MTDPQPSGRLLRQPSAARFALLVLLIGGFGLLLLLVPRPDPAQLPRLADRLGGLAPVAAILGGALLLVALVPRTFITLAAGAIFGPLEGAAYALGAALLAAAIGFTVGRLLGREFVAERVRGRLARLDGWFARQSVLGVVTVRLLPIAGFGLVSYGYGTTGARVLPFLAGSVIASAPDRRRLRGDRRGGQLPRPHQLVRRRPGQPRPDRQRGAAYRWWQAERRRRLVGTEPRP